MKEVAVVGVGSAVFGKLEGIAIVELVESSGREALKDASIV